MNTAVFEVFESLKSITDPSPRTIYLVKDGTSQSIYNEYIYADGKFEQLGTTTLDIEHRVLTERRVGEITEDGFFKGFSL